MQITKNRGTNPGLFERNNRPLDLPPRRFTLPVQGLYLQECTTQLADMGRREGRGAGRTIRAERAELVGMRLAISVNDF